jgi:hypothetical protein
MDRWEDNIKMGFRNSLYEYFLEPSGAVAGLINTVMNI